MGGDLNFDNNEDFFNQGSGVQMNSMGGGGFQPAMVSQHDDDLTEEERALIEKVRQADDDRKRALYEKQNEEMRLKE